jgi:hypothetical protein
MMSGHQRHERSDNSQQYSRQLVLRRVVGVAWLNVQLGAEADLRRFSHNYPASYRDPCPLKRTQWCAAVKPRHTERDSTPERGRLQVSGRNTALSGDLTRPVESST